MSTELKLRKTHKYVGTYQHEDQWEYLGRMTMLQYNAKCTDEEDPCEPTTIIQHFKVELENHDPVWTDEQVKRALRDTLTRSGCHHDYDCCGCVSTHVSEVLPLTRHANEYIVISHSFRNY